MKLHHDKDAFRALLTNIGFQYNQSVDILEKKLLCGTDAKKTFSNAVLIPTFDSMHHEK